MSQIRSTHPFQQVTARSVDEYPNDFLGDAKNIKVREYINSAVYVESTFKMNSCNQTIYFPGSGDHPKTVTVKRCACFSNPDDCPCHPQPPKELITQAEAEGYGVRPSEEPLSMTKMKEMLKDVYEDNQHDLIGYTESCINANKLNTSSSAEKLNSPSHQRIFESDSGITVKASNSTADLRLSIPSLTSIPSTIRYVDGQSRAENFREWCRRKNAEKKLQEEREHLIQKIKEQQKQAVVELERENFKHWLATKLKQQEEAKKMKALQEEEERRTAEEKKLRLQENERNFQHWLRRKEKRDLEKKIHEQLSLIEREEEKQRRSEISHKAYEYWKEHSKNRQKPVPFGLGVETLQSSASVSYINPQPWVPNVEPSLKPHSQ